MEGIEMLNVATNLNRVKAGLKGGAFYKSIRSKGALSITSGYDDKATMSAESKVPSTPFTGKTFMGKRK